MRRSARAPLSAPRYEVTMMRGWDRVGLFLNVCAVAASSVVLASVKRAEAQDLTEATTSPPRTEAAPPEGDVTPPLPDAPTQFPRVSQSDNLASARPSDSSADIETLKAFLERHPDLDCPMRSHWSSPTRVWVACESSKLLVLQRRADEGLDLIEARSIAGEVMGFFEHDGRVWARVLEEKALVVGKAGEAGATPPEREVASGDVETGEKPGEQKGPSAAVHEAPVMGNVTRVSGLEVEVDRGTNSGISLGARIAFADGVSSVDEKRRAAVVGRVVDVTEERASVQIGLNETVQIGSKARLTDEAITGSRIAPKRAQGLWELRGILRPLLSLGDLGGGVLGEFEAGYRMRDFHVGARVSPLGVARAGGETVSTWGGYAYGAYDSWLFSAGLGIGAQAVNDTSDDPSDPTSGLSLVQLLRLGAVDGLHLTSRIHAVVFRGETEFSSLEAQGQIPVASGAWLILRGGGGTPGHGFGEIALRNLLFGSGGRGSTFLEVSVGGAGIFEKYCESPSAVDLFPVCSTTVVAGPLVGIGAEWRL